MPELEGGDRRRADVEAPGRTPGRPWPLVSRRLLMVLVLVVLALVLVPWLVSNFWLRVSTTALMVATLALALNLMIGLAGYPALGNMVFFGVGGYITGLLAANLDVAAPAAIALGALGAAGYALVASRAMLSLRGSYFLMATVALNFLTLELIVVLRGITRGARGVTVPPLVTGDPSTVYDTFYFLFLGLLGVAAVVLLVVRRSRLGLGLLAIKGNEDAAMMLGVPTFRYKAVAWALSAALTGAVGGLHAYWIGFIDPDGSFDLIASLEVFLVALLGGPMLVLGPIVASFAYQVAGVIAWSNFTEAHLAVLGILIVLVVMYLPGGLPELPDKARGIMARLRNGRHGHAARTA
jgi:branched-chain amino acid transport system permease protein